MAVDEGGRRRGAPRACCCARPPATEPSPAQPRPPPTASEPGSNPTQAQKRVRTPARLPPSPSSALCPGPEQGPRARSCQPSFPPDLLSLHPRCSLTGPQRRVPPPGLLAPRHPAPPSLSLGLGCLGPVCTRLWLPKWAMHGCRPGRLGDCHGGGLASDPDSPHLGPVAREPALAPCLRAGQSPPLSCRPFLSPVERAWGSWTRGGGRPPGLGLRVAVAMAVAVALAVAVGGGLRGRP